MNIAICYFNYYDFIIIENISYLFGYFWVSIENGGAEVAAFTFSLDLRVFAASTELIQLLPRQEIFGSSLPPHRPQGVLSTELQTSAECGESDGLVLSVLVPVKRPCEEVPLISKYSWLEVSKQLGEDLLRRLDKNMIVPLNVIR